MTYILFVCNMLVILITLLLMKVTTQQKVHIALKLFENPRVAKAYANYCGEKLSEMQYDLLDWFRNEASLPNSPLERLLLSAGFTDYDIDIFANMINKEPATRRLQQAWRNFCDYVASYYRYELDDKEIKQNILNVKAFLS